MTNGDSFVNGTRPSSLFQAMNRDQLSDSSISSSSLLSFFFLFLGFDKFGICLFLRVINVELKAAMLPCIIVHHPCPTMECQHGRNLNSEDLRRKVSGIPRMVYSNRRIS